MPTERRERYFHIYAANLTNVGLAWQEFPKVRDTFLCPFCCSTFGTDALLPPPKVSIEHCIPQALGGTDGISTLICKECNNHMGTCYDSHLHRRVRAEEFLAGISEDTMRGHFEVGEGIVRSDIRIEPGEDGGPQISVFFDRKKTHPEKWDAVLHALGTGVAGSQKMRITTEFGFRTLRHRIALLRIGYLMAFREFGYGYILHPNLDCVRKQIMTPAKELIPYVYVSDLEESPKDLNRVAVLDAGEIRAFLVRVRLTAGNMTVHKGILMPGVEEDGGTLYDRLTRVRECGGTLRGTYHTYVSQIDRLGEPEMVMRAYELWHDG